jgi:amidase
MSDDLAWLDGTGQAELVRAGSVSPAELLEAAIARIEQLNPKLNAVITPLYDKAMAAVGSGADGLPDGPFRGVPFLVKDAVCATGGDAYHCGMRVLKQAGWTAPADTWLAGRFRAAGFVICGKTNLPELATSITTEPLAYGPTLNPWDTGRSAGGSSGGAGAAVASGMVPIAHGNDMGGSIRIPSSHCGLVGLKPTRARSTLGPDFGEFWGPTTHEHVLTRSVRDTAAVLDAVAGMAPGDPYTAPPPSRPWREEVGADPGRLRIGFRTARRGGAGESHPDYVAAVADTARLLESLGHHVEPDPVASLDQLGLDDSFGVILAASIARDIERWSSRLGRRIDLDELEPFNALMARAGMSVTGPQYVAAVELAQSWSRGLASWWDASHDVLLLPTVPDPPPAIGELGPGADLATLARLGGAMVTFTVPFNMTGQPAISLPLGWSADGLPVGIQLIAGYGREDQLIRLAAQLEEARPWAHLRPPVSAG